MKFSKWMVEKGYGHFGLLDKEQFFLREEGNSVIPTPQMLVGYQLEYLAERFVIKIYGGGNVNGFDVILFDKDGQERLDFIQAKTLPEALETGTTAVAKAVFRLLRKVGKSE